MTALPASPWSRRSRLGVVGGLAVGALLVVVAAIGAAGEDAFHQEIAWLDLGVLGVIVGGATVLMWLLQGRRAVTVVRNQVVELFGVAAPIAAAVVAEHPDRPITVAGSTWYHRPGCLLISGKPEIAVRSIRSLSPCQVCGG